VFSALQNVVPSHLADTQLFDFKGLKAGLTPLAEGDTLFDPPELPPMVAPRDPAADDFPLPVVAAS